MEELKKQAEELQEEWPVAVGILEEFRIAEAEAISDMERQQVVVSQLAKELHVTAKAELTTTERAHELMAPGSGQADSWWVNNIVANYVNQHPDYQREVQTLLNVQDARLRAEADVRSAADYVGSLGYRSKLVTALINAQLASDQ